ncbi:uncharacterized protein LOC122050653 [Zingiber officinale]|uniref:uncharacterized protein LOC122050653 n=1 Tax=Zingiber officinale TaxID=94328 RepID=UPI001C4B9F0E|nr:uncharacterized protein LOC122050653 [Zingiber officinale]
MEDTGRSTTITLTTEELERLIQAGVARAMEQQQRMLADRPTQEPAISGSGHPVDPGRGVEPITHPDVGKRSDTIGPAPNAPIPFHRALFRTPSEEGGRARRDRGSSSDEALERDARKGKAPRDGDSPERINDQFSRGIMEDPLPRHYTPLAIGEYNGSADPDDHLAKFDNAATLHQYTDGVKCRPPTSENERQLVFTEARSPRSAQSIHSTIFNQTAMDIPAVSSEVLVNAFTQGLVEGEFFRSIICRPPKDFPHLQRKATEYINVEEAQAARRKETPAEPQLVADRRRPSNHQPPTGPRVAGLQPYPESRTHAVHMEAAQLKKGKKWTPMFCKFHQSGTHNTWECLGDPNVHRPAPKEYRRRSPTPDRQHERRIDRKTEGRMAHKPREHHPRERNPTHTSTDRNKHSVREEENRRNASRGEIGMILGGPTEGDSNLVRKGHARQLTIYAVGCSKEKAVGTEISFGPKDLEGIEIPHDEALIIKAVIANYTIRRTFIDTGSSVNIIFKQAFDLLQIDQAKLLPMATPLYGFTGNEVSPIGQTRLVVSLGEEPLIRTRTTNFIMVDAPSAYNMILGRLALNEFRAVVSTYCKKIKFPVGNLVGEVRGDQAAARRCYVEMVKADTKAARKCPRLEVNAIREKPPPLVYDNKKEV